MPKFTRNFTAGKMNKTFDERVVPNGEYIDAMNIRMGSTENSEFGVIENTKGNVSLTTLKFQGTPLSVDARCIGAYEDGSIETIYWFVHDPSFPLGNTGKLDLVVSFNTNTFSLTYHVITIDNGGGVDTTLNFNPQYLITGVNKIEDLLFFTDNYNAPRSINVTRNYTIPSGSPLYDAGGFAGQALLEESLLVIKKPPTEAPTVELINTAGEQNFLEERFISFAYRYLYADGQYSATSQWSDIAFSPNGFELTIEAYLNEGMINSFNACKVTYYTGNSLVLGIDLLFKQSESNIIKIIEKQNKADLGIPNNSPKTLTFDNSKIFTVLPEAELLRLYDNVPRFAQAQTLMGNRLMYGNYIEGYDLVSTNGQPLQLTYTATLMQDEIGSETLDSISQNSTYTIDGNWSVTNSILRIDFVSFGPNYNTTLIAGATMQVKLEFTHDSYTGGTPTTQTGNTTISSTFTLAQDYASPFALSQSVEFEDWVGTLTNILPVYDPIPANFTSCDGTTFTDIFNCNVPANQASGWQARASGITAINQPIKIIASNVNSYIDLQLVAMQYEDINNLGNFAYEYYSIVSSLVTFNKLGNARSLHSNRGYEIGIVYMDDFLRSSTALVSPYNIVYTPCSSSANKNSIQVTIPISQVAPYWATRYKFVIKPDQEGYQTVYSTLVTQDADSLIWFLLEGENMQKVEVGDRLIVKKDSGGPTKECLYTTVLEKISKAKSTEFPIAGVYMRLEAGNFESEVSPIPIYSVTNSGYSLTKVSWSDPAFPVPPAAMYTDLDVPVGSVIKIQVYTYIGADFWTGCKKREVNAAGSYVSFTATQSYVSLEAWFQANQTAIMASLDGLQDVQMSVTFNGFYNVSQSTMQGTVGSGTSRDNMKLYINRDPANNLLQFWMSGTKACTNDDDSPSTKLGFSLQRTTIEPDFIFETLPIDALPDIFFENNLSLGITPLGEHKGTLQDQNFALGQDAIIDTGFFNCFSFGNGVESYKVRDSIVGREFNLGERVTSVSAQDYKEAHRFSDITYSGIYNTESNLNKLNEFNLGLLNYKYLESSFGYIYILDGRETDVLCLQEDKISYVLAGKNLLSDAGAGRALTAVPEVLGTQIARTEKYGISHNPESYVQWGADRYFTDTKKGAVIHIQGDSMQSDQLRVVSEFGMRTWFRDEFINSQTTQKLGGYDPYMNEYVLTSNDIQVPSIIECIGCGQINSFNIDNVDKPERIISYCIKLNNCIADGNIVLTTFDIAPLIPSSGLITLDVTYDGTTTSNSINGNGTISVPYSVNNPIVLELQVVITIAAGASVNFDVDNQCQDCTEIFLVEVVITDGSNAGMLIHNQYNYFDPSIPYSSPLQSNQVVFALPSPNPIVSYYNIDAGFWGQGSFPYPGVDTNVYTNKIGTDDFDVTDPPNKFYYHTSNTYYQNNQIDITTLLSVATNITPLLQSGTQWKGTFTTPALDNFLYLIWDLRQSTAVELCFSEAEVDCVFACSECYTPPPCDCGSWLVVNNNDHEFAGLSYVGCDGGTYQIGDFGPYGYTFPAYGALFICARDFPEDYRAENFTYIYLGCFCCSNQCVNFDIVNTSAATIEFLGLVNCGATTPSSTIFNPMSTTSLCVNDYFDAGYFTIPQGIRDVIGLDFQFQECGCEGICCSSYYIYSEITQEISYLDCNGNLIEEVPVKNRTGLFICASEIVDSGTCLVTQLNECQCCATECYTVIATNNSPNDITITSPIRTCFSAPVTINSGQQRFICVNEGISLIYSGGDAADLDMEFSQCDCEL